MPEASDKRRQIVSGYENWTPEINRKSIVEKWVRYATLMEALETAKATKATYAEHVTSTLFILANLGDRQFYKRNKRFGDVALGGDNLYVNLSEPTIRIPYQSLLTALQSASGEGRQQRAQRRTAGTSTGPAVSETEEQQGNDTALSIAKKIDALIDLCYDDVFMDKAVRSQDHFETENLLVWGSG